MYIIRKEFHFSASHTLKGLPASHPCSRLHGHNYVVTVELRSYKLNHIGFVKDYRELAQIKEWIDEKLDHRDLNEVFDFNPTAENIAKYLFDLIIDWNDFDEAAIYAVEVKETDKTSARYEIS